MKKNININLSGSLFAIDEDAYELLQHYTDTLRRYYRSREEGEEVVDDIEARIAELLNEQKAQGVQAITIEHVQQVIQRIGNLEDLAPGADNNKDDLKGEARSRVMNDATERVRQAFNDTMRGPKRFYRDPNEKMLCGVLGGMSSFFGGSPLTWRLLYVIFTMCYVKVCDFDWVVFNLLPLVLYFMVAILAPMAETPEQILRMKGEDVNPQNLAAEVAGHSQQRRGNGGNGALSSILGVVLVLLSVWLWCVLLGTVCGLGASMVAPTEIIRIFWPGRLVEHVDNVLVVMRWLSAVSAVCVFVMAYCSMHCGLSLLGKVQSMSTRERLGWLCVWIVSVIGVGMMSAKMVSVAAVEIGEWIGEAKIHVSNSCDGDEIWYDNTDDEDFFENSAWQLVMAEGCEHYTYNGQYWNPNDQDKRYLDAYSDDPEEMVYVAQKSEQNLDPGYYRLTAAVRAQGPGASIYAITDYDEVDADSTHWMHHRREVAIPVYGSRDGELWQWARGLRTSESKHIPQSVQEDVNLRAWIANDPEGKGWSFVCIDSIPVQDACTVHYGVQKKEGTKCKWFSATDFVLEKIGELDEKKAN